MLVFVSGCQEDNKTDSRAQQTNQVAKKACHLKVGVVPQFPQRKLMDIWTPILEKLDEKTPCSYELVGSKNIDEFEKKFQAGDYDLAYMNPFHAVMANDAQGYEPIVRSGAEMLQGILVVKKDSPIKDIKELDGKEVAFPSPNALGASLMMRAELASKGVNVKPKYVKTHDSVYLHVIKGLADIVAGGGVERTFKQQPHDIQDQLRILYETKKVNAHPLVINKKVSAKIKEDIRKAFLEIGQENPELTDKIPMKNPVKTSMQDYQTLKKMGLEKFKG